MRYLKTYEWSFRTLNEFGDCYDLDHTDDISKAGGLNDDEELELVLTFGNAEDGIMARAYALVDHRNCILPETFEENPNGYKVPQYIRKQFNRWVKRHNNDLGGITEKREAEMLKKLESVEN